MSKTKTFAYATLLFISGVVCGAIFLHLSFRFGLMGGFMHPHRPTPNMIMKRLDSELDLTKDQHEKMKVIVEDVHKKFTAFREEARPRIEAIIAEGTQQASTVLTPAQQEKLLAFQKKMKERFQRRD